MQAKLQEQLSTTDATVILERLPERCRSTKRGIIEKLLIIMDSDVSAIAKIPSSEWDAYF